MTIRPNYDAPARLSYINKVIQQYHRLPIELVRWAEGYHTLTYDTGDVYEEHSIYVPYTSHLRLGAWVREAIAFAQRVREAHGCGTAQWQAERAATQDDPALGRESELRPGFYEEDVV